MDASPAPITVYVLKDGARIGPFTIDDLLELVDSGEITYDDVCLRSGSADCERVRQVLDWDDDSPPPDAEEPEGEIDDEFDDPDGEEEDEEEETDEIAAPPPRRKAAPAPRDPRLILYAGHPSVLSFPGTLLLIAASVGAGIRLQSQSGWWLFAGLILALFGVSWILLQRSLRFYLITPRRVEVVKGFIAKSSNEVRVEDIRAINVHTPGLTGLLGVGTVEFASAGGAAIDVAFTDVYAAHRIKSLVRRLQDAGE